MSSILSIVTNVTAPVAPINPKFPPIPANLMSISPDFTAVCAQLLSRRAFLPILAVFAHVATTLSNVAANVAPIGTNVFRVRSNLATIRSQFSSFPTIDLSLTGRCTGAKCEQRRHQQHPGQKCNPHFLFLLFG
jgi:hypothetical protein